MMEMRSLEDIWSEAKPIDIGSHLTDGQLASLGRIYLSIHSLIACTHPEGFREEHAAVLKRIDRLFDECLLRCRQTDRKETPASFVPLLYRLGMPEYQPLNAQCWEQCDQVADKVVNSWTPDDAIPWETQHSFMRVMTELLSESDKAERQSDAVFLKYAGILSGWKLEVSEGHLWENIPCREALSRLELFCRNSTLLLDNTYDEWILPVYNAYRQTIRIEESSDEAWSLLLALEEWTELSRHDSDIVERIQMNAVKRMGRQRPGTDGYWSAMSVLAECICIQIIASFQP